MNTPTPTEEREAQQCISRFNFAIYSLSLAFVQLRDTMEELEEAVVYMEGNGGWKTVLHGGARL